MRTGTVEFGGPAGIDRIPGIAPASIQDREGAFLVDILRAFWIVPPGDWGPMGFGVTAYDFDDALNIIRSHGYARYLPTDLGRLTVIEGVRYDDLDTSYVRAHMGPIVVRGMWYPFVRLGV